MLRTSATSSVTLKSISHYSNQKNTMPKKILYHNIIWFVFRFRVFVQWTSHSFCLILRDILVQHNVAAGHELIEDVIFSNSDSKKKKKTPATYHSCLPRAGLIYHKINNVCLKGKRWHKFSLLLSDLAFFYHKRFFVLSNSTLLRLSKQFS